MNKDSIWVVIPAYNESKHISNVIKKTKEYCKNIIVIDDGSRDDTYEIAKNSDVYVLKNIVNMGKGAALKTGCDFAIKKEATIIIVMDSDGQHNPEDIIPIIKKLENNDILFTYRKFSKKMPLILKIGNIMINRFTRLLYGINLKDTQCGFRAFTSIAYKKIRWNASDYSMESEMIAKAGKHKLKYVEYPIETIYSDKYKGTTVIDGFKIIFNMIKLKFGG
jgi:UDP-N-acetylglucosamine---dolichyl-phosphate N-acetylglucosaminyltransferase